MRYVIVFALMLPSAAIAQIYKCEVDGRAVYSQKPCAVDAQEFTVRPDLSSSPSGGLREAERRMLDEYDAAKEMRDADAGGAASSGGGPRGFSCSGITVSRWTPFDITEEVGGLIKHTRCAAVVAALPGYANQLFDTHKGADIAGRFTASFADGRTRGARNVPSLSGRQRIELSDTYNFNVCFGVNKFEIEALWCN